MPTDDEVPKPKWCFPVDEASMNLIDSYDSLQEIVGDEPISRWVRFKLWLSDWIDWALWGNHAD